MISSWHDALRWLDRHVNFERIPLTGASVAFHLGRMETLLQALEHPERRWPAIHVAGTKGKGSTCAMLASMVQAGGYRVGLYTSPHLIDLRERIQVDGRWVTETEFIEAVEAVRPAVERLTDHPTYFEVLTAVAFWLFARWRVDLAVVEVGLGGRLDATNVIAPLVSVITPISFDHTQVLGSTLAAIAAEKSGIIKPGRPVMVAPQSSEALAVIRDVAAARRAPVVEASPGVTVTVHEASTEGQRVSVQTPQASYPALTLPLLGAHQVENLVTAIRALETLPPSWAPARRRVAEGVAQVQWPGRLHIVDRRPWLILDGAQNAASAEALARAVQALWPGRRVHLVLGISADKDVEGVARALAVLRPSLIVTQARSPRALPGPRLADRVRPWFSAIEVVEPVADAVALARRRAHPDDCVLVTGSFFLIGELLQAEAVLHE